jgi:hypothetical protein
MRKKEIKNKFDEIVDFAEIEKFIDTPVKRYSSDMYVRLAFTAAAHLELGFFYQSPSTFFTGFLMYILHIPYREKDA